MPDVDGVVDLDALADALDDRTVVVSVMLVNNEVGTIQPLAEVAALVRDAGAARACCTPTRCRRCRGSTSPRAAAGVDLVAISAHKFGGPKGTGALVVRDGVALEPLIEGGGQERGLRSGTSNVAGAVAMAAALRATRDARDADVVRIARAARPARRRPARARFPARSRTATARARSRATRTSGSAGVEAEALLVAARPRRACARPRARRARRARPSRRTCSRRWACPATTRSSSIRLSLGFASTDADVDVALAVDPGSGRAAARRGRSVT